MIDLNMRALTDLSLAFVDSVTRHRGGILNVASVAGFLPAPASAVYYASKAYVISFSEALHRELKPAGVRVTVLCPGPVQTEFQARAGVTGRKTTMFHVPAMRVAEEGYRGLMRGKRMVIPGFGNRALTLLPRLVAALLAARRGRQPAALAADQSRTASIAALTRQTLAIAHQPARTGMELPADSRWAFACQNFAPRTSAPRAFTA